MGTILERARALTTLYVHMCGTTEVPKHFNFWCCLSLIAALVEDKVWYEKHRGVKLAPNLYVFLYGPPAVGKGMAIGTAYKLFHDCHAQGKVWHGSITREGLIDVMGGREPGEKWETGGAMTIAHPKVWLITDELGDDIGRGAIADNFIKFMTKLYTSTGMTLNTGTRTHGQVTIEDPLANWLAGTTEEWMIESLDKNMVGAGFPSRVAFVRGAYDSNPAHRHPRPLYPEDYWPVREHILTRLWMLQQLTGEFRMTDEAYAREQQWYCNRPFPEDVDLVPSWKREQDLILKLAMLLVLAEGGMPLLIDVRHFVAAQKLSESVQRNIPSVVEQASETPELTTARRVTDALADYVVRSAETQGWVTYQMLYNRLKKKGVSSRQLKNELDRLWANRQAERVAKDDLIWWRWKG